LDNAPARSAELLAADRVDAALVPVAAYQTIDGARIAPGVCVGAREQVRSVCLVARSGRIEDARSVALDISSRTSVLLTKIIFKEFFGFEPEWKPTAPDLTAMLAQADAALMIGDPALKIASRPDPGVHVFDLARLWHSFTGLGFIFAMWMTKRERVGIDFAAARDEGLRQVEEIVSNYEPGIHMGREEMLRYLTEIITYEPDEGMLKGMELYFELAERHGLIALNKPVRFI
jgi:chorismate dehydratase